MSEQTNKSKRSWTGTVVSDKMDKTIVVKVERVEQHPVYGKRMKISKKYKVHDEANAHAVGDTVTFEETRAMSKDKKWIVK